MTSETPTAHQKTDGRRRARKELWVEFAPTDFTALDRDIDEFITAQATADTTKSKRIFNWRIWEAHCATLGVDPLDAPFTAYEELFTLRRQDGVLFAAASIVKLVQAVIEQVRATGNTPAHKLPHNRDTWRALMSARRAADSVRREEGDEDLGEIAVPLMRADLVRMLEAQPVRTRELDELRAAALLMLETGMWWTKVEPLVGADVVGGASGALTVTGVTVPCDHTERVRGVPWDCAACAVRAVMAYGVRDADRLFSPRADFAWRTFWKKPMARFEHLLTPRAAHQRLALQPREDLTDWEAAGLRRAVVLRVGHHVGERWVRSRAWVAMAWTCGLRMSSDAVRLPRDAVTPDADGRGWRLRLDATKDDQIANKQVTRALSWADDDGPSAAQAMTEYLCVRDAFLGREGALINELTVGGFTRPQGIVVGPKVGTKDLTLLAELAGLAPVYTTYSTRRGYAAQADADGWDIDEIREGLRQQSIMTTTKYLPHKGARDAVTELSRKLTA